MVNSESELSPIESLSLITRIIAQTTENIRENSFPLLLWGWLMTTASFSSFLLRQYTDFPFSFIPFPVLTAVGITTTLIWYTKRKAVSATETHLNYFLSRLWLVLGICFIAVVFMNVSQNLPPFTYTLLVAAIGTFVSGLVMKFKPLTLGGVIFLLAAVSSIYIQDEYKVLIHGVAIITGYLIPGYLLKNQKQYGATIR